MEEILHICSSISEIQLLLKTTIKEIRSRCVPSSSPRGFRKQTSDYIFLLWIGRAGLVLFLNNSVRFFNSERRSGPLTAKANLVLLSRKRRTTVEQKVLSSFASRTALCAVTHYRLRTTLCVVTHYRLRTTFCAVTRNEAKNTHFYTYANHTNAYPSVTSKKRFPSFICSAAEYKFPDPIPEFADAETEKFRTHLLKKLSKKDMFGESVEEVVGICTEIFNDFLHTEYGGPGTLLVIPFIDMADTINERGLPGGPQASRTAVKWAQDHVDKDWKEWTSS
ncbi:protein PLASTID REDOX INSENSITIVE 2 [Forsythia ovata]|uniref:Protein PLASTID REDOX INSENSITIVE 2 n=1 Tax=Forsythia ovata TaxID=205694 RepID=A0ABD1WBD5_9LAMI